MVSTEAHEVRQEPGASGEPWLPRRDHVEMLQQARSVLRHRALALRRELGGLARMAEVARPHGVLGDEQVRQGVVDLGTQRGVGTRDGSGN